ncbi:hypothetical protein CapIbe_011336 [Capra ibex]
METLSLEQIILNRFPRMEMNSRDEFCCIQRSTLHLKWKSQEETTSHWSGEHRRPAIHDSLPLDPGF